MELLPDPAGARRDAAYMLTRAGYPCDRMIGALPVGRSDYVAAYCESNGLISEHYLIFDRAAGTFETLAP